MAIVSNVHAMHRAPNKPKTESQFVIRLRAAAVANRMWSDETVMNVKMDIIMLYRAMVARVVIVIRSEVLIRHANVTADNATVNQALLGTYNIRISKSLFYLFEFINLNLKKKFSV